MCAGKRGGGESSGGEAAVNRKGKKSSPHIGGKKTKLGLGVGLGGH